MASAAPKKTVQVFGRKRAAVAVALCKEGKGLIRVNGQPLHLLEPEVLRVKVRRRLRGNALGPLRVVALSRTLRGCTSLPAVIHGLHSVSFADDGACAAARP